MANEIDHIDQANRNAFFINACSQYFSGYCWEWVVVGRFYTALHIVEAIYYKETSPGRHWDSHTERNQYMPQYIGQFFDKKFCDHYQDLFQLSMQGRYHTNNVDPITANDLADSKNHFEYIVNFAKANHGITLSNIPLPTPIVTQVQKTP